MKYYWLILFLPGIGCVIYLALNVSFNALLNDLSLIVKRISNPNYTIQEQEKLIVFSDTIANKKNLADEYMKKSRIKEAIQLYESCLSGSYDDEINQRLIKAYYLDQRYADCVESGKKIVNDISFRNSEDKALLAMAYYNEGQKDTAESLFKEMNAQFSNYFQRLEYVKLLVLEDRIDEAKSLLQKMIFEIDHMDDYEKRLKRNIYKDIVAEYAKKR